jgi:hypothetical protein
MFFGGAQQKLDRLGLKGMWNELENVLTGFRTRLNKHDSRDSGIVLRRLLDNRFRSLRNWNENKGEGVDWISAMELMEHGFVLVSRFSFQSLRRVTFFWLTCSTSMTKL